MSTEPHKLYSITIFGYKKEGMDEAEYHEYVSKNHAGHLKALLAKEDIVSYTMVLMTNTPPLWLSSCLFKGLTTDHFSKATQHTRDAPSSRSDAPGCAS